VGVGVAEVGTVQDHGAVQEGLLGFVSFLQPLEQLCEQFHVPLVDGLELLTPIFSGNLPPDCDHAIAREITASHILASESR